MVRLFLVVLLFVLFQSARAIEIAGRNKDYSGRILHFYKYADPVSEEEVHVFSIEFDNDGHFTVQIDINHPTFVFSEFGAYKGNLILIPDQNIELLFPSYREKSFAERKNPYFTPLEFWFATSSGKHLVDIIAKFDNRFNQLTDQHFNQLYFGKSRQTFDSIKALLDIEFKSFDNILFVQHQQLQLKALEADVLKLNSAELTPILEAVQSTYWNFPVYIHLLNKAFTGKLGNEAQSVRGKEIQNVIVKSDLAFMKKFIKDKYGASGNFSDLVLIKLLHDGYYSGIFSQEHILNFLKIPHLQNNSSGEIRQIAKEVFKKLTYLRTGTKAPVICLKDINGNNACTTDDNKQFKYIVFADTEMVVVREQLKYLTKIDELFKKHLSIYVVLLKTDLIEMKKFLVEHNIPGVHLVDGAGNMISEYKVRTFPACFLLNAKHEVAYQDVKAPLDGFEQQFGAYLRDYLFKNQR